MDGSALDTPARNDRMVETMLNPSTKLRAGLHRDVPKAKTPKGVAGGRWHVQGG
jgi:hypothetical protein